MCTDSASFLKVHFSGLENTDVRRLLLDSIDESFFSEKEWIDALKKLHAWLEVRGLEMGPENAIRYISCVEEAVCSSSNLIQLSTALAEMLETYGCERAVKKA